MKRLFALSVAAGLIAGAGFADAADIAVTPAYKVPVAPAVYNWTGFYSAAMQG
jgi:hypothetical protein